MLKLHINHSLSPVLNELSASLLLTLVARGTNGFLFFVLKLLCKTCYILNIPHNFIFLILTFLQDQQNVPNTISYQFGLFLTFSLTFATSLLAVVVPII